MGHENTDRVIDQKLDGIGTGTMLGEKAWEDPALGQGEKGKR